MQALALSYSSANIYTDETTWNAFFNHELVDGYATDGNDIPKISRI
jgi:hypothetical protein